MRSEQPTILTLAKLTSKEDSSVNSSPTESFIELIWANQIQARVNLNHPILRFEAQLFKFLIYLNKTLLFSFSDFLIIVKIVYINKI
jgi:hypothetical protein